MQKNDPSGVNNILRGLGEFLELLSGLAEQGNELTRSAEVVDERKNVKAVYGFSVRMGGDRQPRVERFGTVRPKHRGVVIEDALEPMLDVFDEGDYVRLVVELPGVDPERITFQLRGDVLSIEAAGRDRRYSKRVTIPAPPVRMEQATSCYRNGIFELKLPRLA